MKMSGLCVDEEIREFIALFTSLIDTDKKDDVSSRTGFLSPFPLVALC